MVKIDKNKLSELKHISLTILENLHELELAGKPLELLVYVATFKRMDVETKCTIWSTTNVEFPQRLASKPWDKLDLDEFACIPEIFPYDSKAHGRREKYYNDTPYNRYSIPECALVTEE
ncbi:ig(immunoglobulin) and lrr(leucine rich repeat) domain [Holotrichia oblita]|uniref:Ig(Immunoglobulin) and lrr(Leucine rich repeat) domain n=1 Tax=Holotrichia oblita TaxID=644536 RepID=A0ACB9T981_HOLOL|nr:ig(immunoglobulin) and lrr(leucine rich repeat) domain [Holotrichia oblita]